ncbi:MAG: hypothetical protein JNK34_11335 [Tabrizicola sp.]|nr:hypothetical protein [Tabrizicola sp.]
MADTDHITAADAIVALELAILRALDHPEPGWCRNLHHASEMTGIPREVCRAIIRGLIEKGDAEYHRALWSEDGMPAGAGYCLTLAGKQRAPAEWGDDD